jgi:serine/threonine protein kinase
MAQVIPIGQPENDPERQVIALLRDGLSDDYRIVHNFELRGEGGQWFEVDLAVVAPHAVYLVDVKSTYGEIHVAGGKWHPEGRAPFASPLAKLRQHARKYHGFLSDAATPASQGIRHVWCEALVILTHPSAVLRDPEGKDRDSVVHIEKALSYLRDPSRLPEARFTRQPTPPFLGKILEIFSGKNARPSQQLPRLGLSWQCEERLTANDFYTEFRARNATVQTADRVILRVYRADPYKMAGEREAERARIANAYTALTKLPPHPCIPAARDFFATEREDGYVLVLNDAPGSSLRVHITKARQQLTMDQKLRVAEDLLGALAHCHAHGVIHRAVSPDSVLLGLDGKAKLIDFDFARPGAPRDRTIAGEVVEVIDHTYLAPEVKDDPSQASPASDVYGAGATLYELFTGRPTFKSLEDGMNATRTFPEPAGSLVAGMPEGFDEWLEALCRFDAAGRPDAAAALAGYRTLFSPPATPSDEGVESTGTLDAVDYANLPAKFELKNRFLVEGPLGKGGFGRVYKVVDTYADETRALKIITQDRSSTRERMKQEFRVLTKLPAHENVVRVFDGDCLEGDTIPYILMEYVEGESALNLIRQRKLSLAEAVRLGVQVAQGLDHCHRNSVSHGDIKPDNLLWTPQGRVKIIDFNVSVRDGDPNARGGGTPRYLPPDYDPLAPPNPLDRYDRDIFALAVTLYEAVTGMYPWENEKTPQAGKPAKDPREISGCEELSESLVALLLKAISPRQKDRFASASVLAQALIEAQGSLRKPSIPRAPTVPEISLPVAKPNTNPFVSYLLTLYSQSTRTNAGTRGLDDMGRAIYVETALDRELQPATLQGQFRLVLISGNAGDGKTAFIQQIEALVRKSGQAVTPIASGNGSRFEWQGHKFLTNYDGSQDEGDKVNDQVLREFFKPFAGSDANGWTDGETRIIAINEGRLIDFLEQFGTEFHHLRKVVQRGLASAVPENGVAVVNLNLRSVVARGSEPSILANLLRRLAAPEFWQACQNCDLRDKCYVHHNARTFANPTAGAQVIERLELLFRLVTLRGKLHITMRDLRSALAYMLAGTRDCGEIHELHRSGKREEFLRGYYFNSFAADGILQPKDRLLRLIKEIDVAKTNDPKLDRAFDFHPPDPAPALMEFDERGRYDRDLLKAVHADLPLDYTSRENPARLDRHRRYVDMLRRRHFFEARDESWRRLVPYDAAGRMLALLENKDDPAASTLRIIEAINHGEGISRTSRLRGKLALQVRPVDSGVLRSYRVFDASHFTLLPQESAHESKYIEHSPGALLLRYMNPETGLQGELVINLDVYEMLDRLSRGYRPTVDEIQGYYLSLAVFKNILGSAPYQEVLLTPNTREFYSVARRHDASLQITLAEDPGEYHATKS